MQVTPNGPEDCDASGKSHDGSIVPGAGALSLESNCFSPVYMKPVRIETVQPYLLFYGIVVFTGNRRTNPETTKAPDLFLSFFLIRDRMASVLR